MGQGPAVLGRCAVGSRNECGSVVAVPPLCHWIAAGARPRRRFAWMGPAGASGTQWVHTAGHICGGLRNIRGPEPGVPARPSGRNQRGLALPGQINRMRALSQGSQLGCPAENLLWKKPVDRAASPSYFAALVKGPQNQKPLASSFGPVKRWARGRRVFVVCCGPDWHRRNTWVGSPCSSVGRARPW